MSLEFLGIHKEILEDETSEIDIEGARMCGKTWLVSAKVQKSCLAHPGIWWLICRYSGTETDNQLRPQFTQVCRKMGCEPVWNNDESAYWFPEVDGKISKVFAYGLKTQSKDQRYAKIRGSGFSGLYVDQTEELPEDIGTECRAMLRQPGYRHQLIFSPNPPDEEHWLADQFPDDKDLSGRKYYRLSLYENRHNLQADTIEKMERAYPPTHAKYKSLILGQRGPNITGTPVYSGIFSRDLHVDDVSWRNGSLLLEGIDAGKHHPAWLAAQRSDMGHLEILGGIIGKRMFLEDFLPIVDRYRSEWFEGGGAPLRVWTCADPPPSLDQDEEGTRYSLVNVLRDHGLRPRWRVNGNAPDVREAVIQHLGAQMRRHRAFVVNRDPSRWLMASAAITKHTKIFVDALEGSYVWDENFVSVGNKKVRQPRTDAWLDGWMRCLENIALNFSAGQTRIIKSEEETSPAYDMPTGPNSWMY